MGRPINKKYFGNRNQGVGGWQSPNHPIPGGDDFIGGEGVASYGSIVAGSGWTTNPDPYFSAPGIPSGVTVAGTVHYKALSFTTTANGSGYAVGDVLEVNTGTASTKARAPVASIVIINTPNISNGGSQYDVVADVGDQVTFTHANLTIPLIVEITAVDGSNAATTISVIQGGVWNGSGAPPTSMAGGVNGFTATTSNGPLDSNGTGLVLNGFSWGVYSFGTVSVAGDYTVFPSLGTSLGAVTGAGMNAEANIVMGLLSVVVTQKGSGYVNPADAALLFDEGANGASAVAVLTTDSGAAFSSTNQENAIIVHANTGDGTEVGDIVKQTNDRRYRVKTAFATKKCQLVADSSPSFDSSKDIGEVYIQATDDSGNTYFVTRLTSRVATLERWTQNGANAWLFANGARAKWTFGATSATVVQIENA